MVKALRYKLAGRGFDSRWCQWNFSLTQSFRSHYSPGVDSASNRNEYQVYFLGVKAADALGWQPCQHPVPLSWNLGTLTSWNPLGHSRPVTGLLYLFTNYECTFSIKMYGMYNFKILLRCKYKNSKIRHKLEVEGNNSHHSHWRPVFVELQSGTHIDFYGSPKPQYSITS